MRRFRWSRFQQILRDPTRTAEVLIGICFVLLPGVMMMLSPSQVSVTVGLYLEHYGITDGLVEAGLILAGFSQIYGAGTEWYRLRGWLAFGIGSSALTVFTAYFAAQESALLIVAVLPGIVLSEGFIAWRCWHTLAALRSTTEANRD